MLASLVEFAQTPGFAWAVIVAGCAALVIGAYRASGATLWGDLFGDELDY